MSDSTMLKIQIAAIMFGSAIALTIIIVGHFDRHPASTIVEPPACDTNANGSDAVEQLAARMKAGVASTDCDLQQLDHVASLARACEVELHMDRVNRMYCETELHDCESAPLVWICESAMRHVLNDRDRDRDRNPAGAVD